MIRTKGEAGTGNVVEAVRHQRAVMSQIRQGQMKSSMLRQGNTSAILSVERLRGLPVVNFAAGGIATPGTCCLSDLRSGFNRSSPSTQRMLH